MTPDSPRVERVPISALQHFAYCPRQSALIHVEQTYEENVYTLRGNRTHERVDDPGLEIRGDERRERSLPLWSEKHGLMGKADLVVFPADEAAYPIEFKAGSRKEDEADDVQVCAQALCLEEMFGEAIDSAEIYYDASRRRRSVPLSHQLRSRTLGVAEAVRRQLRSQLVPGPVADERCPPCSLVDTCMPFAIRELTGGHG